VDVQNYRVKLQSEASKSYRCSRAANSLDIDVNKKLVHELSVNADVESDFSIGLIVGASGSGKTTLARSIYGDEALRDVIDLGKPIIDQFPSEWSYDDCASALIGIGLSSVPCWIRPSVTLSNGQRARAEAALKMLGDKTTVIDEWTSVVDRTVAKAMSVNVSKYARKNGKRIVLLSCHYDVLEWLCPDWIIDCNTQQFEDWRGKRWPQRGERLTFTIAPCASSSWRYFAKYHYLSENLPGGGIDTFGLFHGENQIGFQCFARYVPGRQDIVHSNRTVIHPDYVGFGLGGALIDSTSAYMTSKGFDVRAKFSSTPVHRYFQRFPARWRLEKIVRDTPDVGGTISKKRGESIRKHVKCYIYRWIGGTEWQSDLTIEV
jgi:ABC-type dipeptide/oligopeptide/nickel transport system ATPase subunit